MKKAAKIICALLFAANAPVATFAANPIVQTCFTTDPAPMVFGDRIYLYTGHDEDNADFFWMNEWRIYSSADMVNWTDHGSPLAIEDFSWADERAWAPQCIERNGKFYLYVPLHSKLTGTMAIGVAVADSPVGPFKDAIGAPLADGSWDYIDPTVMIDHDGQAYLFWGNPEIYYVKLNDDMISYSGEIKKVEQTVEGFGAPGPKERVEGVQHKDNYTEGPWIMKRGSKYYLLYAAGGVPEHIAYSMADSPEGPWTYMGHIMPLGNTNSFTNHCGVTEFKGQPYFFYHTGTLPGGGGFARSCAVEAFNYNPDGTFPTIEPTTQGAPAVATFNPYGRIEAETMAWSEGVNTEPNAATGLYLSDIHNGDYTRLDNVDFSSVGPRAFGASVASALRGGLIEVHIDSIDGPLVAKLDVPGTGGWENWRYLETAMLSDVQGVHDVYFAFKGRDGRKGPKLFNVDYWKFQ